MKRSSLPLVLGVGSDGAGELGPIVRMVFNGRKQDNPLIAGFTKLRSELIGCRGGASFTFTVSLWEVNDRLMQ